MKMFYRTVILICFSGILLSCGKDNLTDVVNEGTFGTDDYFRTEDEVHAALMGVYDPLSNFAADFTSFLVFFNAASDDFVAGGGSSTDQVPTQAANNYTIDDVKMPTNLWTGWWQGISRANLLLERVDDAEIDEMQRKRVVAEAKTLRSFYYFQLLKIYGNVPLILKSFTVEDDFYDVPQEDPAIIYAQIENDIKESIGDLPAIVEGADRGRLSEGSARAILGKIYLFDEKYDEAAAQLKIVNGDPGGSNDFGYKLLDNFADLWKPENSDFNSESIFEVVYTDQSNATDSGPGDAEGNLFVYMTNPRSYTKISDDVPNVHTGWGFNPVTQNLAGFLKGDPRFEPTIFEIGRLQEEGKLKYEASYQDVGFFLNKFLVTLEEESDRPGVSFFNYGRNQVLIRLADSYLMEAEALGAQGARAQALLDAVRARVGLPSIPVSMQAIKDERRAELAGEGQRWFDLVRWGDAPTALSFKGFKAGKNELMPIPFQDLANTKLVQNPGY